MPKAQPLAELACRKKNSWEAKSYDTWPLFTLAGLNNPVCNKSETISCHGQEGSFVAHLEMLKVMPVLKVASFTGSLSH